MYAVQLEDGNWLSLNGKTLWFEYKGAADTLAQDLVGRVWERSDFEYVI